MLLATAVPLAPAPGLGLPWARLTASAYQTSKKPGTVFNYVIFARLDFSELSILEEPNTGPGQLPSPAGWESQQAGQAAASGEPPASHKFKVTTNTTRDAGGKGHSYWLSIPGGERKMEDLHAQLCSPEETSSAGLVSLSSTRNTHNGIIITIQWLRQAKKDICSYVAGKPTAVSTTTWSKFLM